MLRILLILFSSIMLFKSGIAQSGDGYRKHLSAADTCNFGEGKYTSDYPYRASLRIGGYDGTKLNLSNDKGVITFKDVSEPRGKHQSELDILYCFGEFISSGDTVIGNITSQFEKLFLFDITKNFKVDSFDNSVTIKILSNANGNKAARTLITCEKNQSSIAALPYLVDYDQLFKARHPKETLAFFTYFEVIDKGGHSTFYDANDYLLVGGNYFVP